MSVLIRNMSLETFINFMRKGYGDKITYPKKNEKLMLLGCEVIEVRDVRIEIENDFTTFGNRFCYVGYPTRERDKT